MLGLNIEWRGGRCRGCLAGLLMRRGTSGHLLYGKGVESWVRLYFSSQASRSRLGISKPKPTQAVTSLRRQPRTSPSGHDASGLEFQSVYVCELVQTKKQLICCVFMSHDCGTVLRWARRTSRRTLTEWNSDSILR